MAESSCEVSRQQLEKSCPLPDKEKLAPHMEKILEYLRTAKSAKGESMLAVYDRLSRSKDSVDQKAFEVFLKKLAGKGGVDQLQLEEWTILREYARQCLKAREPIHKALKECQGEILQN